MAGKVVKLEIRTVYQKTVNGSYYFRYQTNGQRKALSLKTQKPERSDCKSSRFARSLRRKTREEQEHVIRRLSFSRAQEAKLLEALDDDNCKVMNKAEIKVIYYLGMFTG